VFRSEFRPVQQVIDQIKSDVVQWAQASRGRFLLAWAS
jgi:hypothetical protein